MSARSQPGQADEHDPGRQSGAGRGDGARPERDPARRGHRRRGGGRRRRCDARPVDASTAEAACARTPISEQAIVGAAIGAAIVGMRPVAEIMLMNFTTVAMDMIVNHAAKLRFMSGGQTHVPLTIRTMTGAGFGTGGQHADYLEAWFAHTAGIKVVAPSNPADAYGLMLSCIFDDDPCLFIENMPTYWNPGPAPKSGERIPLGKAQRAACRQGRDSRQLQPHGRRLRGGRGQAREGRRRCRAHRPAHRSAV